MQSGASGCMHEGSGPGRARLKLRRHPAPNALSAHLFFGALCTGLWCTGLRDHAESMRLLCAHAR